MNILTMKEKLGSIEKKKLYGATLAIALVVLVLGYALFGRDTSYEEAAKKVEAAVPVSMVTIVPKTIDAVVSAVGTLNSRNSSVLSSKIMGKVIALHAKEGDQVSQGKLLLKIESGEIRAQVFQAQAAYNNAKLQYDRIKRLFDEKAATQMEIDQATLGLDSANAGLNGAKAMESYTIIEAPISGQIIEKRINLGEMALPGQPLIRIEDNRNLRLEVTVREQDLRYIQAGKPVIVQIDALPGKDIKATVAQVVPASDIRTHSFIVKIDIPSDKSLITGMYGKALFNTGKREAILVPRAAIVEMSGISGVYIISAEGSAVFQMVQPGDPNGDSVEAVTGLRAGDQVIVSRHEVRLDGRKVVSK